MSRKDQDFINKIFRVIKDVSKVLPSMSKDGKSAKPFDIVQGVEDFINKMIDGVTIGAKNLPTYMSKVFEINRDAQKAFDDGRYSDYIMLRYKGAEIFYNSFYKELFNKEIKDDEMPYLTEIIKEIDHNFKINSGILKELNDWRIIRNKIVHEHLKVDRKKAEEAKQFFNNLYKLFENYIREMRKTHVGFWLLSKRFNNEW